MQVKLGVMLWTMLLPVKLMPIRSITVARMGDLPPLLQDEFDVQVTPLYSNSHSRTYNQKRLSTSLRSVTNDVCWLVQFHQALVVSTVR